MTTTTWLCATLLAASVGAKEKQTGRTVAVLEFRMPDSPTGRTLIGDRLGYSEQVRRTLGEHGVAHVVTRDEMQDLAAANPDALDRCADDDSVALGRLLGADAVIDGTFSVADGTVTLVLRLVDTGSGRIIVSHAVRGRSRKQVLAATREAIQELAVWLKGHSTPRTRNSSEMIW